jgi:small subunit ribosomal protein S8
MTVCDPIADMLTRIRNAGKAKFKSVDVPASNFKTEMAKVLKDEGYIKNYKMIKDGKQGILRIWLKYDSDNRNAIYKLERISKPSKRMYIKSKDAKPFLSGTGCAIISTSKGVMTDKQARNAGIGGEILCRVW